MIGLFGNQLGGDQFAGQIPDADLRVETIRTAPVEEATVDQWVRRQAIINGAWRMMMNNGDASSGPQIVVNRPTLRLDGLLPIHLRP
ncbi:MAG: hypothetical protein HC828_15845 [Blastochloris sp.]|nr:hypothetical protein [Blastochloris sp.]